MAGQVKFILDAESAKAVNGFLKIVDAQKKLQSGMRSTRSDSTDLESAINKIGQGAVNMVSGFFGLAGVKTLIHNVTEELNQAWETIKKFEQGSKGGVTLGPNIGNIADYQKRSIELSNKFGVDIAQVQQVQQEVGTIASHRTPEERKEMETGALRYQQVTGQDAKSFVGVQEDIRDAYPQLSGKQSEQMIEFLRQKGSLDVGEQQGILPTLLPSMTMAGAKPEETEAFIATVTKLGGKNSQLAKGGVNLLYKIGELKKEGLLSGEGGLFEYMQQLADLEKKNPALFDQKLGPKSAPVVHGILEHQDLFNQFKKEAGAAMGGNVVADEAVKLQQDPTMRRTLEAQRLEQIQKNMPLTLPDSVQEHELDWQKRKVGAEQILPHGFKWTAPGLAGMDWLMDAAAGGSGRHRGYFGLKDLANFDLQQNENRPSNEKQSAHDLQLGLQSDLINFSPASIDQSDQVTKVRSLMKQAGSEGGDAGLKDMQAAADLMKALMQQQSDQQAKQIETAKALNDAAKNINAASTNILNASKGKGTPNATIPG